MTRLRFDGFRAVAVLGATAVIAGCSADQATAPRVARPARPAFTISGGLYVLHVKLDVAVPSATTPSGNLQVKLNAQPGDPCGPTAGLVGESGKTALAICGTIKRAATEDLTTDAGLYFLGLTGDQSPILVAGLKVGYPVDPCRTMQLRGGLLVSDALAIDLATNAGSYFIKFGTVSGRLRYPSDPSIPPSPIEPTTDAVIPPNPIAPEATQCTIEVTAPAVT